MSRVTVFITTIGSSTFKKCLAAVRRQAPVEIIANVSPWSAAQNEMVKRCRTELFIQLDEDMILYRDGVRQLVKLIDSTPANCVMACAPLFDVDLEMPIMGTKIYRHALIAPFPFEGHVSGDVHDRLVWAGAGLTTHSENRVKLKCVGDHGTLYTPEEIFERWRRLWQRHRRSGNLGWVELWLPKLKMRLEQNPTRLNYYAFLGAVTGATEELWGEDSQVDFRRANPTLDRLTRLLDE